MKKTDVWWKKYSPETFDELILNDDIKPALNKALKEVPNLMLVGPYGVGKSAYANIFLQHTGLDYLWINGSDERGIDVVRKDIKEFGRAYGITHLKVIVINEADELTPNAQTSLHEEIEVVADYTRFIFIANRPHKLDGAIHSRCQVVEINRPPAKEIFYRLEHILSEENVAIKKTLLKDVIKECYPDIRRMINSLQMSVSNGKIEKVVYSVSEEILSEILSAIKEKDVEKTRRLLRSNTINYPELYKYLFDNAGVFNSPGDAILALGEAHRWDSMVSIREINFMTCIFKMIKEKVI